MPKTNFYKYQATGNDFIAFDNRNSDIRLAPEHIMSLCHRRTGIGADGIILIESDPKSDFKLIYYNNDGSQSLCGNGCRAGVQFAAHLGIIKNKTLFAVYDGLHDAEILSNGEVKLYMRDVLKVDALGGGDYFVNTGSPHLVREIPQGSSVDVVTEGRKLRYDEAFKPGGVNVNFVESINAETIYVRTYERGVEDETLSCGTGVTAAALAMAQQQTGNVRMEVRTQGGNLSVTFTKQSDGHFEQIYLIGPAVLVFSGAIDL